jgi:hypothetical protein
VAERRWCSNDGELPRRSAAARGAPAAPRETEGHEGRHQLKKHRAMAALTMEGEGRKCDGGSVGVKSSDVEALR